MIISNITLYQRSPVEVTRIKTDSLGSQGDRLHSSYGHSQAQQESNNMARQTTDMGDDETDAISSIYEDAIDDQDDIDSEIQGELV